MGNISLGEPPVNLISKWNVINLWTQPGWQQFCFSFLLNQFPYYIYTELHWIVYRVLAKPKTRDDTYSTAGICVCWKATQGHSEERLWWLVAFHRQTYPDVGWGLQFRKKSQWRNYSHQLGYSYKDSPQTPETLNAVPWYNQSHLQTFLLTSSWLSIMGKSPY